MDPHLCSCRNIRALHGGTLRPAEVYALRNAIGNVLPLRLAVRNGQVSLNEPLNVCRRLLLRMDGRFVPGKGVSERLEGVTLGRAVSEANGGGADPKRSEQA